MRSSGIQKDGEIPGTQQEVQCEDCVLPSERARNVGVEQTCVSRIREKFWEVVVWGDRDDGV